MASKDDNLIYNDQLVELLSLSLHKGANSIKHVPDLLQDMIQNNRWQKRVIRKTGQVQEFSTFVEFVQAEPLEGLGSNIYSLRILCSGSPNVLRMINELIETNNHQVSSYPYLVEYLKKDNPELAMKIMEGEVSLKAAAKLTGFSTTRPRLNPVDIKQTSERIIRIFDEEWQRDSKQALAELVLYLNRYLNH